jgi:Xaa-Pro aminopeptidase
MTKVSTALISISALIATAVGGALTAEAVRSATPAAVAELEREPLEQYRERRRRLAGELGGVVILFAAPATDLEEFRQENNFYYLTGFNEPQAILMLDTTGESLEEVLFIPPRDPGEERWTGVKLGPGPEAAEETGIAEVADIGDFERRFGDAVDERETVFTLTGQEASAERLRQAAPGLNLDDASGVIETMRMRKSETEIDLIEKAVAITLDAHRAAVEAIEPGAMEYQAEAAIEFTFRWNGAQRPAFPSIVGSGPFSTVLHYDKNERRMESGDLVVVDIGAEYGGYAADVTRTYPVDGTFTPRQREIYEIVLGAQKAALDQVRPGARLGGPDSIHTAAWEYIDSRGYGEYFIHGTSHYLGLYVHDVGSTRAELEPNMVLTVEPGIYIPEENIGVRIEDDVVVTEDGYRLLSDFPREAGEIEALISGIRAGISATTTATETERQTTP